MDYRAHLVCVSGVANSRGDQDKDPRAFFAQRFPNCLLNDFSFLDNSSNNEPLLYQNSNMLLEKLRASRESSKQLPIIFLAHGLGGFVVKQALLSATEEPRYRDIALHTSTVFFLGVCHRATRQRSWDHLCLRLFSASRPAPEHPLKLLGRLVVQLEDLSASFRTLCCSFDVVNFHESSKNPVLNQRCSTLGGPNEANFGFDCQHDELWKISRGDSVSEEICKQILAARSSGHSSLSASDFLRLLSLHDPQTYQLKPAFPAPLSLERLRRNEAFTSWKNDPVVGILRIGGASGSGITVTASHILGTLLEETDQHNTVCLSFSFDKNNIQARSPLSLSLSLCRQLLSFRPRIYQRVPSVSHFLTNDETFSAGSLWVMLHCIMTHLLDDKEVWVYCIIDAVDECIISQAEVIERMEGFVRLAKGRFKLLLSGIHLPEVSSGSSQVRNIVLESSSEAAVSSKKQHVQDRVHEISMENPAWHGLANVAADQLDALPVQSPYLLVKLNMLLLGWTGKHSTRKDLKHKLQQLPTKLEDCYAHAMAAIDDANRGWVTATLRWIVYAVRPMRPTELAVAAALSDTPAGHTSKDEVPDGLDDLIRRDIIGDLGHFMVPFIKVDGNRVYLIHDTFRIFLLDSFSQHHQQTEDLPSAPNNNLIQEEPAQDESRSGDGHYGILVHCLDYLKSFGRHGSMSSAEKGSSQSSLPTDPEFGLLSYASLQWPQHFRETTSKSAAHDYVLQFLQDDERVAAWAILYHQLKPSLKPESNRIRVDNPLKIVCNFGLVELVDDCIKLVKSSAKLQDMEQMRESLDLAAQHGHDDVVRRLLKEGAISSEALGLAAAGGFEDIVKELLSAGSTINEPSRNRYAPLHHATLGGYKHIVSLLLENGANLNVTTALPLESETLPSGSESSQSDSEYDSDFSDSASDMDESGSGPSKTETNVLSRPLGSETSLHLAAFTGQTDIAKSLIVRGSDVGAEDSSGYDTLKYAAAGGFPELLELLLQHEADPDTASSRDGNTALHLATLYGHYKAAEILLQKSYDASKLIRTENHRSLSPIHIAAREGHLNLLEMMLGSEYGNMDAESMASVEGNDQQHPSSTPPMFTDEPPSRPRRNNPRKLPRRSTIEVSSERASQTRSETPVLLTTGRHHHKSPLELAAESGHPHVVRALLAKKGGSKPDDRAFALNWAAQNGHANIVTILLEDVSVGAATDSSQRTALHLAAQGGHTATLNTLLTTRAAAALFDIDAKAKRGWTPVHVAARAGHADILEILLENKAKTDTVSKTSRTALHLAAKAGHLTCVQTLLRPEYGIEPKATDIRGRTALHLAAQEGQLAVVKRLCSFKDLIWAKDDVGWTALDMLVRRGKTKEVEEFIRFLQEAAEDDGVELVHGGMPLHLAARDDNIEMLRLLLDRGWKCDAKDDDGATPLHRAVWDNLLPGVRILLQNPLCDITAQDNDEATVLHEVPSAKMAKFLLEAGAPNDQKDGSGRTPLWVAAFRGRIEVVRVLLDSEPKPDINTKDDDDWSLLHAAYDSLPITELMLQHHVDPNTLNDSGRTPLALAIRWDHPEVANMLLGAGANPNLAGDFEDSPLYLALKERSNSLEVIQLLAENGADLLAKDSDGNTALHIAAQDGDKLLEVKYLVQELGKIHVGTTGISDICTSVLGECVSRSVFNSELADSLVSRDFDVNRAATEGNLLYAACSDGTVDAVRWLLEKGVSVNVPADSKHETALCGAVKSGIDAEAKVNLLLENGAEIDHVAAEHPTALQIAISSRDEKLIKLLLDKKANVNLAGGGGTDIPLITAIRTGVEWDTIQSMLKSGADITRIGIQGLSPVHVAAIDDRVDVLREMMASGGSKADLVVKDTIGLSALMHGVLNLSTDVVGFLLAEEAFGVSETDSKGQTPLIVASVLGSSKIVSLLLESAFSGALDAQDYEGKTALAHATSLDQLEIVSMLVNRSADAHVADSRGRSPLYWAARAGRMEMLDIVIKALDVARIGTLWDGAVHGAVLSNKRPALERLLEKEDLDVEHAGPDGWTPLYTARRCEFDRMVQMLEDAGAIARSPAGLRRPSRWHAKDRFPGLGLASNGTTLSNSGENKFTDSGFVNNKYGAVRADYPMLPLFKDKVYYFEIKITNAPVEDEGYLAVGFCDDNAPLCQMLGWNTGSWGFHSDDGCLFEDGKRMWEGIRYSTPYTAGDVIGCGVNFAENMAFYTRKGEVIGRAFLGIRGKLYPAVSMGILQKGWEVTAVFPKNDGKSAEFVFQGDYDGLETFKEAVVEEEKASDSSSYMYADPDSS